MDNSPNEASGVIRRDFIYKKHTGTPVPKFRDGTTTPCMPGFTTEYSPVHFLGFYCKWSNREGKEGRLQRIQTMNAIKEGMEVTSPGSAELKEDPPNATIRKEVNMQLTKLSWKFSTTQK